MVWFFLSGSERTVVAAAALCQGGRLGFIFRFCRRWWRRRWDAAERKVLVVVVGSLWKERTRNQGEREVGSERCVAYWSVAVAVAGV